MNCVENITESKMFMNQSTESVGVNSGENLNEYNINGTNE